MRVVKTGKKTKGKTGNKETRMEEKTAVRLLGVTKNSMPLVCESRRYKQWKGESCRKVPKDIT